MTREESIVFFERLKAEEEKTIENLKNGLGITSSAHQRFAEHFNMAISALREQESLEKKQATETSDKKTSDKKTSDMTNAQKIRSMTDEELADYMCEHSIEDICYIVCGRNCKAMATFDKTSHQVCREIVADWLKQPYKEDT